MELFEKLNKAFGGWYENLFGGSDDVRPKDILRKILVAMEGHRKEGIDNRVYVPNRYILEIEVADEEEKEYLLSFLDQEELETAIRRYCQQHHYTIRGTLDFTIKEVEPGSVRRKEKVLVKCRYDKQAGQRPDSPLALPDNANRISARGVSPYHREPEEDATVYEAPSYDAPEDGTVPAVAYATLTVLTPGKPTYEMPVTRGAVSIGRSAKAGNDIVLAEDGMVSRRHARIELDVDGLFTCYDLDTTNGTRINGEKIDNRALKDGDEIQIGTSRLQFHQTTGERADTAAAERTATKKRASVGTRTTQTARIFMLNEQSEQDDYLLGAETLLGRGMTNNIVLADRSVAMRHATICGGTPYTITPLSPEARVLVNQGEIAAGAPFPLRSGDLITLGIYQLRFVADEEPAPRESDPRESDPNR